MNDMQSRLTELLNAGVGDPPVRVTVQAVRRQRARRRAVAAVGAASAVAVIAVAGAALSGRSGIRARRSARVSLPHQCLVVRDGMSPLEPRQRVTTRIGWSPSPGPPLTTCGQPVIGGRTRAMCSRSWSIGTVAAGPTRRERHSVGGRPF